MSARITYRERTTMATSHWPAALPRSLDYPDVPVGAILDGAARRWNDRTAFHYSGQDLSFQLADCGAVAVVTLDFVAASVAAALDRTKVETVIVAGLLGPVDLAEL